ncbi:hypothetical protein F5B22DRAFT_654313 [Xylaria bambusicola]|uniref:uncharacterized protein n=1 Tax=Xylaria bambusicola TaxID=326684 RepID=UPI00200733A0|nr:uncharacterized protein F5B22DRAFT_654313 [Xylaria bambusicola]KAI0517987.1 hypothetical protein F5B22DRAFT_654313 [Xylaria bambusicola]
MSPKMYQSSDSSLSLATTYGTTATSISQNDTLLVVGIDFGTTHSGVSWAIDEGDRKVRLITDWKNPSGMNANEEKVPSKISYQNGRVHKWGYETSVKEDSFKWIKILLEPEQKHAHTTAEVKLSNKLLKELGMTADQVVRDYLKELWAYTRENIRRRQEDDDWESTFHCRVILTVPAMWSHQARERTLKAAKDAGFPDDIQMVTEPEAAALATLKSKAAENTLRPGDAFVVCDAGGGTVDLISYRVKSTKPLQLEECAMGDGDLCGSVFLDLAFERYITTIVGEEAYSYIKQVNKNKMLREFEFGVKRAFDGAEDKDYSVDLKGVEDNIEEGIVDDTIPLKLNMLRTIFDHIYCQIDTLVQNQVSQVQAKNLVVKSILLVGGFGGNRYIHSRLEAAYRSQNIRVLQVEGAWSAICRGACLWGLEQPLTTKSADTGPQSPRMGAEVLGTVASRISKYSYGIKILEPFDIRKHEWHDRCWSPANGGWMADNQMLWMLKRIDRAKGETYEVGKTFGSSLRQAVKGIGWRSKGVRSFEETLYISEQAVPPSREDGNVQALCSVTFFIPERFIRHNSSSYRDPHEGHKWRDAEFEMVIRLRSATLDFIACCQDVPIGHTEASYERMGLQVA